MQSNLGQRSAGGLVGNCFGIMLAALIFLLVGGGLTYWGWTIVQDAQASTNWPTTTGLVTQNEISYSTDPDGGDTYSPELTYEFQVDGVNYGGYQIKFGENAYGTRRQAEEVIAPYPLGRSVTVYYEPANPGNAVLEPGLSSGSYIVLAVGLCFMSVSAIAMLMVPLSALSRRRVAL